MDFSDVYVGKRLWVGEGNAEELGRGEDEIRGSAYIEGPLHVGDANAFLPPEDEEEDRIAANVMLAEDTNGDSPKSKRTLHVKGNVAIDGDDKTPNALVVDGDVTVNNGNLHTTNFLGCTGQGVVLSGSSINVQGWKGFDIKHPSKKGHRLRHVCVEGPEAAIYCRGRVHNRHNVITLPEYWDGLVDYNTLTVQLTPIHSHQNVIVKRIDVNERKIHLQTQGGMPVDAFYHIMAARIDGEPLIVEYEGKSAADYPGDPTQFSISGYDYGRGVDANT